MVLGFQTKGPMGLGFSGLAHDMNGRIRLHPPNVFSSPSSIEAANFNKLDTVTRLLSGDRALKYIPRYQCKIRTRHGLRAGQHRPVYNF